MDRFIQFIFFGNIFVGLLAIALSIETAVQLNIPFNNTAYYTLLFFSTMAYYTYAYINVTANAKYVNPRTKWYSSHRKFVRGNLALSIVISLGLASYLVQSNFHHLLHLHWLFWMMVALVALAGASYYGLLPKAFGSLNIRNTGLLKSFVIGFVWASCVNIFPLMMLKIEGRIFLLDPFLILWLFIKTFMFCTVNAIMFDIKDYAEDANKQLKTFVVRFGLRNTIFWILIPLLLIGVVSMTVFISHRHYGVVPLLINMLPFMLSILVAYSMHKRQNILYYLIVIDGLLLVKAICGIAATQFVR